MFIQTKKIKGIIYFYLVDNKKENGMVIKDFEKCLGNTKKVDFLFEQYLKLKERYGINGRP